MTLQPDPPARIPQLQSEQFTDEVRSFLGRWTGGIFQNATINPMLLTLAHHPALADAFSQFNVHLLSTSTLPVRQRQIAIMRTAWISKSAYLWSSHLRTSSNCGLEPGVFERIKNGAADPYFTPFERAIISATDELVTDKKVSEAHWQALASEWSIQQLLDFLFTVGCYAALAGVTRSIGIQRADNLLALADQYGAPVE
jgi:4-carboxymuconolactone decarboxylase